MTGQLRDDKSTLGVGGESRQPDRFSFTRVTPLLLRHFLFSPSFRAPSEPNCDLVFDRISLIEMP